MITIVDFKKRQKEGSEEEFLTLIAEGSPEVIQSTTGNFYVTARRCSIPTTLHEEACKKMIGQTLKGSIEKVTCEPYLYEIPSSGKTVELNFTYKYNPVLQSTEEAVFEGAN